VPDALALLVARLSAKNPADRPQSAREILGLLDRIELSGEWSEDRLRAWWDTVDPPPTIALKTAPPSLRVTEESARRELSGKRPV
jgi:hypothetical protein